MISKSIFLIAFSFLFTISCFAGSSVFGDFTISSTSADIGQTVTVTDASNFSQCLSGTPTWAWEFGEDATPATATGAGPHDVTYSTSGEKIIKITASAPGSGFCAPGSRMHTLVINEDPIPTMSQWALVIFGLLITSIAVGRIWIGIKHQA